MYNKAHKIDSCKYISICRSSVMPVLSWCRSPFFRFNPFSFSSTVRMFAYFKRNDHLPETSLKLKNVRSFFILCSLHFQLGISLSHHNNSIVVFRFPFLFCPISSLIPFTIYQPLPWYDVLSVWLHELHVESTTKVHSMRLQNNHNIYNQKFIHSFNF